MNLRRRREGPKKNCGQNILAEKFLESGKSGGKETQSGNREKEADLFSEPRLRSSCGSVGSTALMWRKIENVGMGAVGCKIGSEAEEVEQPGVGESLDQLSHLA